MSKFHTYSFGNVMPHSHAKPGCILCGRVSHMEEEFGRNVKAHESGLKFLARARIGGSSNRTSWTRTVSPCLMQPENQSGNGRWCSL